MESIMFDFISKIRWGEIKEFNNLTIIPLFAENGPKSPDYLTMEDAINSRLLIIGEKNSGGSVPELMAQNLADILADKRLSATKGNPPRAHAP